MRLAYKFYSEGYDYEKGITITSAVIVDPIKYLYVYSDRGDIANIYKGMRGVKTLAVQLGSDEEVFNVARALEGICRECLSLGRYLGLRDNKEYRQALTTVHEESLRVSFRHRFDDRLCTVLVPAKDGFVESSLAGTAYEVQNVDLIVYPFNFSTVEVVMTNGLKLRLLGDNGLGHIQSNFR
jgi:hypothetical protein